MINLLIFFFFIQQTLIEYLLCSCVHLGIPSPCFLMFLLGFQAACGVHMSFKVLCGPTSKVIILPSLVFNVA